MFYKGEVKKILNFAFVFASQFFKETARALRVA